MALPRWAAAELGEPGRAGPAAIRQPEAARELPADAARARAERRLASPAGSRERRLEPRRAPVVLLRTLLAPRQSKPRVRAPAGRVTELPAKPGSRSGTQTARRPWRWPLRRASAWDLR